MAFLVAKATAQIAYNGKQIVPFLRNAWYMVGWSSDLAGPGTSLARIVLGDPIVVFRSDHGSVGALLDRCPHRFAPLSKGAIRGASLVCGYHGLAFGGDGRCTANPHGRVTRQMAVRAYPVREAYLAIWIWMGDPAEAGECVLPDLAFIDAAPQSAFSSGYLHARAHYQLLVDNILDLSHADYLHPDTLGGGSFTRAKTMVEDRADGLSLTWTCENEEPLPITRATMSAADRVDMWTQVRWYPAGIMSLRNGTVPTGSSRDGAREMFNLHIMTPETEQSSHYFFAASRNFDLDDTELNDRIAAMRNRIFLSEDEPMIAAQQERLAGHDFWEMKPLLLRTDEGAVRVRRKLEAMIAKEQAIAQQP
jgi:vanillate O-demethylase monooxygenase subunit